MSHYVARSTEIIIVALTQKGVGWLAACLPAFIAACMYTSRVRVRIQGVPLEITNLFSQLFRKKVERFPYTVLFVKINFTSWNISLHNSLNNKLTKKKKRQKLQTFSKTF